MLSKVGITERGDAGWDLSWSDILTDPFNPVHTAVLITKAAARPEFINTLLVTKETNPIILHAGITGWGGTKMEPGIKSADETIKAVREIIDRGFPAKNIVLRIDPVIPTPEGLQRASHVLELYNNIIPDVKRIRMSIYDDYKHSRAEMTRRGYPAVDNIYTWKNELGRRPAGKWIDDIARIFINGTQSVIYETCAEPELVRLYPDRFTATGCISLLDCKILGVEVPAGMPVNGQNRFGCKCLQVKTELLKNKRRCPTNCAYCYWKNS